MDGFTAQQVFIEVLIVFFTLASGFGMIYRTWIKPFNERMNERDHTIIEMQGNIKNNQKMLEKHEEECERRVALLHSKIDELRKDIVKLQVDLAARNQ